MNNAHRFDMITRTVGEPLPDCIFYAYDENIGYKIEFFGGLEVVSDIPLRLDVVIDGTILAGDAVHVEVRKNGRGYIAEYHAYALHVFEGPVPV